MKLTILGMNGPFPAANGACSGYLLQHEGHCVQLDMGTGVLGALSALTAPEELDALVFSHWHFDHCSDVLPMIYRMEGPVKNGHAPLDVYGPVDENSAMRSIVAKSPCFRLHDIAPGDSLQLAGMTMKVAPARHPVPAVMLRFEAAGKSLCYTGDTNTLDSIPDFIRGTDLLLADGLFTSAMWAEEKPHLSAAHCAGLAAQNGISRLVITHLNPTVDPGTLLKEARASFPKAELAARGMVLSL